MRENILIELKFPANWKTKKCTKAGTNSPAKRELSGLQCRDSPALRLHLRRPGHMPCTLVFQNIDKYGAGLRGSLEQRGRATWSLRDPGPQKHVLKELDVN